MEARKYTGLKIALVVFGLFFIFGVYPLMEFVKVGWQWSPPQIEYEQMIMGIYATMGAFMVIIAKNPVKNISFIWFVVWVNIVHATIMLYQSLIDMENIHHLWGDVPALYIVAIIIAILAPKKKHLNPTE